MLAPARGQLQVSGDCVVLMGEQGAVTWLIWPAGYSRVMTRDGTVVIKDQTGQVVASVGQQFTGTGGYVDPKRWGTQPCAQDPLFQVDFPDGNQLNPASATG